MSEVTEEERNRINNERVERLKNSKFKQQMLPAWRPVPTYPFTMTIFIVFGIVFLTLGIVIYAMSNKVQQVIIPYSSECGDQVSCTLEFKIEEDIEGPLYTYYELTNFYQNHRRYVKSRSYTQLMGDEIDGSQAKKDCDPIITNKDMGVTESVDGTALDETAIAYPCGLIAKSVFTDAYRVLAVKGDANSELPIDDSDIAWKSDVEFKFKNQAGDWRKTQWLDVTNQHFIVWMRTAGLPNFRKLYGNLKDGLKKGTYYLQIENTYDVKSFDGSKSFVMSTTNILGGQNYFLAVAYIVVGCICLVLSFIFLAVWISKRPQEKKQ